MASPTVVIFSASSSGISRSNSSSKAITSSTVSSESAPRSSMNFALGLTSSSSTPSCSTMISLTRSSTGFAMYTSRLPECIELTRPIPCPRGAPLHVQAPVDVDDLARDVRGPVAGQESYHLRHLAHPAHPLERDLPEQALAGLFGYPRRHVGLDEARGHRIDLDIPVRELACRRLRETDDARLGRGVVGLARIAHGSGRRGHIDDAPALLPHHDFRARPRHQEHAAEVRVHHLVPVVILHAYQQLVSRDPRVVDQHIEASEALLGRLDEPLAVFALGLVRHDPQRSATQRLDFLGRRVDTGRVAARDYHGGAVLRQQTGDGEADAAGAAGDDGRAAGQRLAVGHAAAPPASAVVAFSSDSVSSTAWPRAPSMVRLRSPVSTRPGPTSNQEVAPARARASRHSVHRTGLATWRIKNGLTSSARVVALASTLRKTGTRGASAAIDSSSAARRSAAGLMRAQWKGALTGKSMLFLAPRPAAIL